MYFASSLLPVVIVVVLDAPALAGGTPVISKPLTPGLAFPHGFPRTALASAHRRFPDGIA